MSTVEYNYESNGFQVPIPRTSPSPGAKSGKKFHRIQEVCIQQGATIRSLSRKMDISTSEIREQENPQADLRISDLLRWQRVLEVPLADLLIDSEGPLSEPVDRRARMLRVMKTAKAILESTHDRSTKRLASMLVTQLTDIMPELAEVSAWHTVGQRRTQNEMGRIVDRTIPDNFFNDPNRGM
jgi:transcriptional regulator with XRE-family HTH domain